MSDRKQVVVDALGRVMARGEVHPTLVMAGLMGDGLNVTFVNYDSVEKLARSFLEGRVLVVLHHRNGASAYSLVWSVAGGSVILRDPREEREIKLSYGDFMMGWIGGGRSVLEIR